MKDPSGNELPKSYENSIQGRTLILAHKLDKAAWILTHACINTKNRTKEEMVKAMNEASELIIEVRKEIAG